MDTNQFRLSTYPNYIEKQPIAPIKRTVSQSVPTKDTGSVRDVRFPTWAAQMSDGRIQTDYRPQCSVNIPTGRQYATRQMMIHNAEKIIEKSRQRMAERTGAGGPFDSSVLPSHAVTMKCTPFECGIVETQKGGIGMERKEGCPELFGTFSASTRGALPAPVTKTKNYEGGRNTPRGGDGWAYEMI
jgi:hypothetical protein